MSQSKRGALRRALVPDIGGTIRRFPIAMAIALAFTLLWLTPLWFPEAVRFIGLEGELARRLTFWLLTGFLWALAVALCCESRSWGWAIRAVLLMLGFAATAALDAFAVRVGLSPILFFAAVALLPAVAPYAWRSSADGNAAFWHFNHRLWPGAGVALVATLLLAGGLWLISLTLLFLFRLSELLPWCLRIWVVVFGLIAPLHWLSLVPRDFSERAPEGEQSEFVSRAIASIVKWVLVPLLLIYTAILYAYAVKIAIEGVLPRGQLGPMVLSYAAVGTLTVLLAFPTRLSGGPLVTFFWRWWFLLTSGPIVLLALAAYSRIDQYGLTIARYLLVLACLWLAALAVLYAFRSERRDLRFLPASACVLLLLASFGPWGAIGASVRWQTAELAALLEAEGRLRDGRLVPGAPSLSREASSRVRSIVRYLDRRGQLGVLEPWFEGVEKNPFHNATQPAWERSVLRALGGEALSRRSPVPTPRRPDQWRFRYSLTGPLKLPLSGYGRLMGPFDISPGDHSAEMEMEPAVLIPPGNTSPPTTLRNTPAKTLRLSLEEGVAVLDDSSGTTRFDLAAAAKAGLAKIMPRFGSVKEIAPLRVAPSDGKRILLIAVSIGGQHEEDKYIVDQGRFWVLLPE